MEWVSVKDALPEPGNAVEVMHNGSWPEIHRVVHPGNAVLDGGIVRLVPNVSYTGYFRKETITHWRYRETAAVETED